MPGSTHGKDKHSKWLRAQLHIAQTHAGLLGRRQMLSSGEDPTEKQGREGQ
jgi:hypothetical protein